MMGIVSLDTLAYCSFQNGIYVRNGRFFKKKIC